MTLYLDHNATTPLDPLVLEEMLPLLGPVHGNPSSVHQAGQQARRVLDLARERVAALIGAQPEELVFTSGGTESVHHAIRGVFPAGSEPGSRLITSAVEHRAVLGAAHHVARRGVQVVELAVDPHGCLHADQAVAALTPGARLISIQLANNEVGAIQPVRALAQQARQRGVLVHSDAVQAAGRIPIDVALLGVDLLSLSSHKLHGPKGVGVLFIKQGTRVDPLLPGGQQETRRRAGTENLPGIAGFGKACQLAAARLEKDSRRLAVLRDRLQAGLQAGIPGLRVNGHPLQRLPNTLSISIPGANSKLLLMALDLHGLAASAGSACAADSDEPSHVLTAMGLPPEATRGALRLSLGRDNDQEQVDRAIHILCRVAAGQLP